MVTKNWDKLELTGVSLGRKLVCLGPGLKLIGLGLGIQFQWEKLSY